MRFPWFSRGFAPLSALLFALVMSAVLTACGKQVLSNPESLPIRTYPRDMAFRMTLVMESCSDLCAKYDPASCSASVEGTTITLDIELEYERTDSPSCTNRCGNPVLAHCDVGALPAGSYTVVSGTFSETITVE